MNLLLSKMRYMFRNFHKAIFRHRYKNATEKKHNSNLKTEFGDVHRLCSESNSFR